MADDPIIIDDGGSTRIKKRMQPGSVGAMDGLLDVQGDIGSPAAGRPGSQVTTAARNSSYGTVTLTFIDATGKPTMIEGHPLPFDSLQVASGKQRVDVDLVNNGGLKDLRITVSGDPGIDPIVDSKQNNKRRRYIVTNAKEIDEVRITRAGNTLVFNANNPPGGVPVIYTTVVIT